MAKHDEMDYEEPSKEKMYRDRLKDAKGSYAKKDRWVNQRIEAHDSSGVEQDMVDLSCYDDGDGNRIAEGDLSVQRMVERGMDDGYGYPEPFDTRRKR